MDEVREDQGEYACQQHWYCHPCLKEAFERAMQNLDEFPAQCCQNTNMQHTLDNPSLSLDTDFVKQYKMKLKEHEVPSKDRVYCANTACAKFQDPDDFDNITDTNTVQCACGTTTCTSCKSEHATDHICTTPTRPQLPPYSKDLRVKECPSCHQPIELRDACNHMVCSACKHQFCFICLLPWLTGHDVCPYYGEVAEGHDDEGFERTERGLHVRTGLNRQGMNRLGKHFTDPDRNDTSIDLTDYDPVMEELQWFEQLTEAMLMLRADITVTQHLLTTQRVVTPHHVVVMQHHLAMQLLLAEARAAQDEDIMRFRRVHFRYPAMPPTQAMPAMPAVLAMPAIRRDTETEAQHRARQNLIDRRVLIEQGSEQLHASISTAVRDITQEPQLTDEQRAAYNAILDQWLQRLRPILQPLINIRQRLRAEMIEEMFEEELMAAMTGQLGLDD